MKFTKMHGCGNDYVYVDCINGLQLPDESALAQKVSDRHFGIGSDGLILIKKGKAADFEMVMYNADGSRSQMCGNGIRCVGKYVYDAGITNGRKFTVESMGAIKQLTVVKGEPGDKQSWLNVDMGKPAFEGGKIPLKISGNEYQVTCVSMGNPHAVVFLDYKPQIFPVCEIGPLFENNPYFPDRTNTEFAYVENRRTIWMRVWERGTGETLACGTGTCATVVAAILNDLVDAGEKITVHLLGGDLEIKWSGNKNDSVFMTGPAETVFEGEIKI